MRWLRACKIDKNDGNSLIEFTFILPFLLLLFVGMIDLCILIDQQLRLIHLGREAASVLSRGADFDQTFAAITAADGALGLDGDEGRIILTRIVRDNNGNPVIVAQKALGGLNASSEVGTLPANAMSAPASVPNGRSVPANMGVVVVELFSSQPHFLTGSGLGFGDGVVVLNSLAAF